MQVYHSIFIRLAVVASQTCQLAQNSAKIWTYSSSRSSKVDFGTNRKGICHFLLVINSNFGPILHRFWDTATYWLKIAHFSYPLLFGAPAPYLPFRISRRGWASGNLSHGATLRWRLRDPNFNRLWLNHPCAGQTDRQRTDRRTDGRAMAYSAL